MKRGERVQPVVSGGLRLSARYYTSKDLRVEHLRYTPHGLAAARLRDALRSAACRVAPAARRQPRDAEHVAARRDRLGRLRDPAAAHASRLRRAVFRTYLRTQLDRIAEVKQVGANEVQVHVVLPESGEYTLELYGQPLGGTALALPSSRVSTFVPADMGPNFHPLAQLFFVNIASQI